MFIRTKEHWLLEWPTVDTVRHQELLKVVNMPDMVHLAFDTLFDHDDDAIWSFIHDMVVHHDLLTTPVTFYRQLKSMLYDLQPFVESLLDQFGADTLTDFVEEYRLYETKYDNQTRSMLLTFERIY